MQENKNIQVLKMECTGCSNYCLLRVELENGEVSKIEGNGCKRAYVSVNRQIEREHDIGQISCSGGK